MDVQFCMLFAIVSIISVKVDSARILMFPVPIKSHLLDQACLAEGLHREGTRCTL